MDTAALPQKISLTLEGNIGAGKSTFLRILGSHLNAQLVFEPHQRWQNVGGENILDHFYRDTKRWAYTFQTYAFFTRTKEQKRQWEHMTQPMQVLERSVYSDRYCFARNCAEAGLMTPLEWSLYQEWFAWLTTTYAVKPSGFIYLRTDPEVCHKRLLKRARFEEAAVSLDYLQALHQRHEDWLLLQKDNELTKDIPVLVLDANREFEHDEERHALLAAEIAEFVNQHFGLAPKDTVLPRLAR
jgi:deoxyadenosine/deoxycytidine kinase